MLRLHRLVIALGATGLLVAWGGSRVASARRAVEWRATFDKEGPLAAEALGPPPASVDARRLARIKVDALMPPDYAGAETLLADALEHAPLRSGLWVDLARIRLFRGDDAGARTALARADALDPGWPEQRLESSRLWFLIGDEKRGTELAETVASWDDESLVDAAESLCQSGYSPAEAWTRLVASKKPPGEKALSRLLERLRSPDRQAMAALWRVLPQTAVASDPALRSAAATVFSDPVVPQALEALWRARADGKLALLLDNPRVLAENPRLLHDPRILKPINWVEDPHAPPPKLGWLDALRPTKAPPDLDAETAESKFPLGWRPFPENVWVWTAWREPGTGDDHGVLELYISGQSNAAQQRLNWLLCTLLVAPSESPVKIVVPVSAAPRGLSILRLGASSERKELGISRESDWSTEAWQQMAVTLPPSQDYKLVDIWIQRQIRDIESTESPRIHVGGISASLGEMPQP